MESVGPERIAEPHPFHNLDGVLGAPHTPDDGHRGAKNVTTAMAAEARGSARGSSAAAGRPTSRAAERGVDRRIRARTNPLRASRERRRSPRPANPRVDGTAASATSMTHHDFVTESVQQFQDLERELR